MDNLTKLTKVKKDLLSKAIRKSEGAGLKPISSIKKFTKLGKSGIDNYPTLKKIGPMSKPGDNMSKPMAPELRYGEKATPKYIIPPASAGDGSGWGGEKASIVKKVLNNKKK